MQWHFSFSKIYIFLIIFFFNTFNFPLFIYSLNRSSCSSYLFSTRTDIYTNHQYIQPCPVSKPCQCLCETESKHLWIDCFYRKIKTLPNFETIQTNNSILQWNIDLAFNLFDNLTSFKWIPNNMHINHLILSGSLAYDLIIQLNLTHRHLIDTWPNQQHLSIINDNYNSDEQYRFFNDYQDDDASEGKTKYYKIQSYNEHMHLLTELTFQLRDETKQI